MKKLMLSLGAMALAAATAHAAEDTSWGTLKSLTNPSPVSAAKAVAGASVSDVVEFGTGNLIRKNGSILKRSTEGVSLNLKTKDLPPGEVITIWWVIFNNPEACVDGCDGPDLGDPAVNAAVIYGGGKVPNPQGQSPFKAYLPEGPPQGDTPFGLPGDGDGLVNSATAEVHVVLRTHGLPLDDGPLLEEQLNTYAGGCTPESSFGIGTGPNDCADIQAAVHLP